MSPNAHRDAPPGAPTVPVVSSAAPAGPPEAESGTEAGTEPGNGTGNGVGTAAAFAPAALAPELVLALAQLAGHASLDADTTARIAVGAANAVAAVTASVGESLFDAEPTDYAVELDRLADAPPR